MEKIVLAQFIAHIVADFFAQPESLSNEKQKQCLASWHIYIHALIVGVISFAMTFACGFIGYALVIAVIHFGIDALKCYAERRFEEQKTKGDKLYAGHYLFFADQLLHLIVIYGAVAIYWTKNHSTPDYLDAFTVNQLLVVAGFLLCMKPANVIIRKCLSSLNLYDPKANESDLARAGRWIGTIERLIAMVLVMLQQYAAIGFIITAKSLLRYNESKTGKTEYVLIGTLLSFGIALLMGICIQEGFFESFLEWISCKR
ncbi:DUF3307 domain-containing protein [Parabacteroides sp. OttesenSCG-928-G06]|nr:DUF3307 domain-containing protein [Parabacteroides sp. OttesenSCG-928-G06]